MTFRPPQPGMTHSADDGWQYEYECREHGVYKTTHQDGDCGLCMEREDASAYAAFKWLRSLDLATLRRNNEADTKEASCG